MSKRILVPITHSKESMRALEFAIGRFPEADITVLHVIDPTVYHVYYDAGGYFDEGIIEKEQKNAEQLLEEAEANAKSLGASVTTVIEHGNAQKTIIDYAKEHESDQIVMGSRGRSGIPRLLLGSVTERVIRSSPVPVTIVK